MCQYNLKDMDWGEFTLSDIFHISSSMNSIDKVKIKNKNGYIPYVTRSDRNNGYDAFIDKQEKYKVNPGNVITIGLDTQTVFYQPVKFYTGQNVQILSNDMLNRYNAIFLLPLLKRLMEKFSWGSHGATLSRLKRSKIILPVDISKKPDWDAMEKCAQEKERNMIVKYTNSMRKQGSATIDLLSNRHWCQFRIKDIFELVPGKSKGLNHIPKCDNGISYLGATNSNNGVLCLVSAQVELVQKGNCIAFIRNGEGSMGYSIYKAEDFIATSDITLGYNGHLNRYVGAFITTVADQIRGKYNFGYKRNGKRLENEIILLPTDENGKPDYKYMENYMKKIEAKQLHMYLNYLISQKRILIN